VTKLAEVLRQAAQQEKRAREACEPIYAELGYSEFPPEHVIDAVVEGVKRASIALGTGRERIELFRVRKAIADRNRCLPPPLKYTLTSIYSVEYIKRMESAFEIIAEPNRRAILSLLVSSEQSVGEIERQLRMTQPTVSKHLRVLREAGFVESTVDAQRRLYRLKPEPLQEVDMWLAQFRRFWSGHVDALERHLDRMEQSSLTREKARRRRRGPNRGRDKGGTK
jgi:DNA-binding transcriptional ArsR family regulator